MDYDRHPYQIDQTRGGILVDSSRVDTNNISAQSNIMRPEIRLAGNLERVKIKFEGGTLCLCFDL